MPPQSHQPPDAELLQIAGRPGRKGRAAFDQLVMRHEPWLMRYLHHLLRDLAAAEDVAQISFVQAYLAIGRFRGDASFTTWLRSIATRAAYNYMRSAKRRRSYEERSDPPMAVAGDRLEHADAVNKVMAALPLPYREIIVLRHLEELSLEEIATTLDIGHSAAKMRLSRARQRFFDLYHDMVDPNAP